MLVAGVEPLPVDRARRHGAGQGAQEVRRRLAGTRGLREPASGEIVDEQTGECRVVARAVEQAQGVGPAVGAQGVASAQGAQEIGGYGGHGAGQSISVRRRVFSSLILQLRPAACAQGDRRIL